MKKETSRYAAVTVEQALDLLAREIEALQGRVVEAEKSVDRIAATVLGPDGRGLQQLDAVGQNLLGLQRFVHGLASHVRNDFVDLEVLTADIRPRDLASRLSGRAAGHPAPDGDVVLF